jgi:hypothetical protein
MVVAERDSGLEGYQVAELDNLYSAPGARRRKRMYREEWKKIERTLFHVSSHPIQYQVGGSRKRKVVFLLQTGERKRRETLATCISQDQTQDPDNTKEFTLRQRIQFEANSRGLMEYLYAIGQL